MRLRANLVSLCGLVAMVISTSASATVFFDRAAFDAANPGLPVLDFEGFAPKGGFIQPAPQPWAPSVLFSDPAGDTSTIAIADSGFSFNTPTDALFMNAFNVPILATFDPKIPAVGFDVSIGFGGLTATVEVFDSAGNVLESVNFDTEDLPIFTTFIGFSDLGDIGSVVITPASGGFVLIDNFAYGIPGPGGLALLGLAGLCSARRRRH